MHPNLSATLATDQKRLVVVVYLTKVICSSANLSTNQKTAWQSTLTSCENFPSWYLTRYSSFPHCTVSCCPSRRGSLVLLGSQCCSGNLGQFLRQYGDKFWDNFERKSSTVQCCPSRRGSLVVLGSQCCSDNNKQDQQGSMEDINYYKMQIPFVFVF